MKKEFFIEHKDLKGKVKYRIRVDDWEKVGDVYKLRFYPSTIRKVKSNLPDAKVIEIYIKKSSNAWIAKYFGDEEILVEYVNITRPIQIEESKEKIVATYVDLIIDILIYPNGKKEILDKKEYFNNKNKLTEEDEKIIQEVLHQYGLSL